MPPGPSVTNYGLKWYMDRGDLYYENNIRWARHMYWLAKVVDPEQITHRSRDVAISASQLQVAELDHRIEVVETASHSYSKYAATPAEALASYNSILHNCLKEMEYVPEVVTTYIREHDTSSMGQGISWATAIHVPASVWREILSIIKENINSMLEHPGWSNGLDFFTGIRARSNPLPGFVHKTEAKLTRSRIILFRPELSIWTIFIPNKQRWYGRIMDEQKDIFHVQGDVTYPMVDGYKSYLLARDYFKEGNFNPYDGKSWEASIGQILGKTYNPFLVRTKKIYQLPSGITPTSLIDSIAMTKVIAKRKGKFIILGDDCNYWGTEDLSTPFLEPQPADRKSNFFLGLTYKDPDLPKISGFKVTVDRSDKRIRIPVSLDEKEDEFPGDHDLREIVTHAGLYLGYVKDGTLLDAIARKPGEVKGPGEALERLVVDSIRTSGDPFAWAERMRKKDLFTNQ